MEISPGIHSICKATDSHLFQLPMVLQPLLFPQLPLACKPNCPLRNPLSSYHRPESRARQKWWALTNETASSVDFASKPANADPFLAVKKKATDVHADLKGTTVFLVGINSAMKTSVGKLIADVLRYYYFDSDSVVEEAAGEDSCGKSFRERDESGFHESETEVLKQLSSMGRLVVNAGNGAVQSATNLALLRHGISVWIDVPLDLIAKGVPGDDSPMSNMSSSDSFSEALSQLSELYEENRVGYATADATVSLQKVASKIGYDQIDQVTAEDMALEVLQEIEKLTRVKKMMEEAGKPF